MTKTSIGNQNRSSAKSKKSSSRFAKKASTNNKKPFSTSSMNNNRRLSPHLESKVTPNQIKSRFTSRAKANSKTDANADARNKLTNARNLVGSLEKAEKSVRSAIAVHDGNHNEKRNKKVSVGFSTVAGDGDGVISSLTPPQTRISSSKKSPDRSHKNEYTVDFQPGPIGLKLEPVLKNGKKEFGCRVMRFVNSSKDSSSVPGPNSPSQALKSGKINVGDVISAVNDKNVTSKSYNEIVSLLTSGLSKGEGRRITFRVPRSPAVVMPKTPSTAMRSKSFARGGRARGLGEYATAQTQAEIQSSRYQDASVSVSSPSRIDTQRKQCDEQDSKALFSPSNVKRLAQNQVHTRAPVEDASSQSSLPLSNILNTVMKSIGPLNLNTSAFSNSSSVISKQIGQALTGSGGSDEMVNMKMELLTELSQAKASLGEQEENMRMMTRIMDDIQKEKVAVKAEKDSIQGALSKVQKAKVR